MNDRPFQVLCLGMMVTDLVVNPVPPDALRVDTSDLESAVLRGGGDALNEATVLVRLGVRTALAGRIGNDLFGDFLLQHLMQAGVDTRFVVRDSRVGTALSVVLLRASGERSFLYYRGAGARLKAEDVTNDVLSQCQTLAVGSAFGLPNLDDGLAGLLAQAQGLHVTTVADTTWDTSGRWLAILGPVLRHVDTFVPSLSEARALVGDGSPADVAARLSALGPATVILKLGADGCFLHTREEQVHIPALPARVIDTTGAGDCFVGGLLAARARGWGLYESACLGQASAACCVEEIGATTGVHNWEQVYTRYRSRRG